MVKILSHTSHSPPTLLNVSYSVEYWFLSGISLSRFDQRVKAFFRLHAGLSKNSWSNYFLAVCQSKCECGGKLHQPVRRRRNSNSDLGAKLCRGDVASCRNRYGREKICTKVSFSIFHTEIFLHFYLGGFRKASIPYSCNPIIDIPFVQRSASRSVNY